MSNSLEQSEVLSLQKQIISWLQKQILLQPEPTTIETGSMMELLGQALDYSKTLIELEERLHGMPIAPAEKASKDVVVNSSEPIVMPNNPIVAEVITEELQEDFVIDEEEPIDRFEAKPDREYYSLASAYELALKEGFVGTQSAFREKIGNGETLFGWRKEIGLGNKPCYFRE